MSYGGQDGGVDGGRRAEGADRARGGARLRDDPRLAACSGSCASRCSRRSLGAGYYSDAFRIGFRIPNLLRDLFAEGALSAAFVPTYARTAKEEGREAAFRLANRVLTLPRRPARRRWSLLGHRLRRAAGVRARPRLRDGAGKAELTVLLTRMMMPFLPLVSFAAVAMGMLNAEERFGVPALSPALFNLVTIVWAAVLWAMGLPPEQVVARLGRRDAARRARAVRRAGAVAAAARAGASGPSGRRATRACCGWPA